MLRVRSILFASVSVLALAPTAAFATSPSEQECIASGGTFTKDQGTVSCTTTTNVGNSTNSQTTTTDTSGQGNTGNKTTSSCSGPGNSTTSSHC